MTVDELTAYLLTPVAQIAIIMGIAELFKKFGFPKKYIPLIDVAIGLLSGILFYGVFLHGGILQGLLTGIFLGLSACGLFSGIKNVTEVNK